MPISDRRGRARQKVRAVLALALSAAGVLVATTPAAAAAPANCYLGTSCLYSGYNYTTDPGQNPERLYFSYCIDRLSHYSYDNIASSFYNNGRYEGAFLYEHPVVAGRYTYVSRGTGLTNLGTRNFNDIASSAYFTSTREDAGTALCA